MRSVQLLFVCFLIYGVQALKIPSGYNDALSVRTRCMMELSNPAHGYLYTRTQKHYHESGDIVTYACERGYDLIGNYRLECLRNGVWNHPEPICRIKSCGRPDELLALRHSSIVDYETKQFTYLEKIIVKCDEWYELAEGSATWRCGDNRKWVTDDDSPKLPVCKPKCGLRLVQDDLLTGLISGGKPVKVPGGWPWMAFIDMGAGKTGDMFCGGTLLDERTVVTTASGVMNLDPDETVDVWLGLLNREADNFNFTQKFTVPQRNIVMHTRFDHHNSFDFDFDIAGLKLDIPVIFSYWVHPICIPTTETQKALPDTYRNGGKMATVLGWGRTERGTLSMDLLKTRVPFVDRTTCDRSFRDVLNKKMISENMLCAGYPSGAKDACVGDDGGPLMTKIEGKIPTWYLSGVVSFGDESKRCGRVRAFGVYTDVGKLEAFLKSHME